jgi:glycosyltransferase involved in cell wall biosynthesis
MPLVSVILPNYNHSKYLPNRIDTILTQTFTDFELIILDDASSDNSREVIKKYEGHPRITNIVFNETNSGSTFLQWEKGIQLSTGKYIWLAESDDYSNIDFLKVLIGKLETNPEYGVAFCASNIIDENDFIKSKNYNYGLEVNSFLSQDFVIDGKQFCEQYLFFGCTLVNASAVVFKKELYSKIDQDFKTYKVCGDWRMWVEICYNTKVVNVSESLNYFRFHTNNVRTNKSSVMNGEAILNCIASFNKTSSCVVRKKLKRRLIEHWFFEFSRDLKILRFGESVKFMRLILKVDKMFFFRVGSYLVQKLLNLKTK